MRPTPTSTRPSPTRLVGAGGPDQPPVRVRAARSNRVTPLRPHRHRTGLAAAPDHGATRELSCRRRSAGTSDRFGRDRAGHPAGAAATATQPGDPSEQREHAPERHDRNDARQPEPAAGVLLGLGAVAFFDEAVFHQLLHWHHFYDLSTSDVGLVSDGLFHAFSWFATVAGLFLAGRLRRDRAFHGRRFTGGLLDRGRVLPALRRPRAAQAPGPAPDPVPGRPDALRPGLEHHRRDHPRRRHRADPRDQPGSRPRRSADGRIGRDRPPPRGALRAARGRSRRRRRCGGYLGAAGQAAPRGGDRGPAAFAALGGRAGRRDPALAGPMPGGHLDFRRTWSVTSCSACSGRCCWCSRRR